MTNLERSWSGYVSGVAKSEFEIQTVETGSRKLGSDQYEGQVRPRICSHQCARARYGGKEQVIGILENSGVVEIFYRD